MPCYDERNSYSYGVKQIEDKYAKAFKGLGWVSEREALARKEEIDKLTDLLCRAGKAYHKRGVPDRDLLRWWDEHKAFDEARGEGWDEISL